MIGTISPERAQTLYSAVQRPGDRPAVTGEINDAVTARLLSDESPGSMERLSAQSALGTARGTALREARVTVVADIVGDPAVAELRSRAREVGAQTPLEQARSFWLSPVGARSET